MKSLFKTQKAVSKAKNNSGPEVKYGKSHSTSAVEYRLVVILLRWRICIMSRRLGQLLLCLTLIRSLLCQECSGWLEHTASEAAPASLTFRPGVNATGNMFLHSRGIELSLVGDKDHGNSLQAGGAFEMDVINCLACEEGMATWPACAKPVSLYARLVGPNEILRYVDVIPVDDFDKGGEAGAKRFRVVGTVPKVPGDYELEVKARWYNGLAEVHSKGEYATPIFLGSEGRKKYHDKQWLSGPMWSIFRQKGGPGEWNKVEQSCVLYGSPLKLSVTTDEGSSSPPDTLCKGPDLLSGNLSGYWEQWPVDRVGAGLFKSLVKDGANPNRMYRLDSCVLPLLSQVQLVDRLTKARVASIHVFGDSLVRPS